MAAKTPDTLTTTVMGNLRVVIGDFQATTVADLDTWVVPGITNILGYTVTTKDEAQTAGGTFSGGTLTFEVTATMGVNVIVIGT